MKKSTRRMLSMALAGTIIAGAPAAVKACKDDNTATLIYEYAGDDIIYVVKDGDTLGKIAEKFLGDSAYYEMLANYNHLENANVIDIDQVIKIPKDLVTLYESDCSVEKVETVVTPDYTADDTYTVKCGDTMYCIVRTWYGVEDRNTIDRLATYNNLSDPNKISVGQVLFMPSLEKLNSITPNDYTEEYNRMEWYLYYKSLCPWLVEKPKCHHVPPCEHPHISPRHGHCKVLKP